MTVTYCQRCRWNSTLDTTQGPIRALIAHSRTHPRMKVNCDCGGNKTHLRAHLRSQKHRRWLEQSSGGVANTLQSPAAARWSEA